MGLQTSFAILSRIVEQQEASGRGVRQVEATTRDGNGDALDVTMDIPISLCTAPGEGLSPDLSPEAATLTDDGGLRVEFSTSALALPSTTAESISASKQGIRITDDDIRLTVELTIDPTDGETQIAAKEDGRTAGVSAGIHGSTTNGSSDVMDRSGTESINDSGSCSESEPATHLQAVRNEELQPYEDTEYLQRLYTSCDTFDEMSQKIEMDVSSETVRRYLIEADIHKPTTYDTTTEEGLAGDQMSTAETAETGPETTEPVSTQSPQTPDASMETILDEQLITDGIGLPEDLHLEDVVDAVVDSRTVFEVQQHLDLERRCARELLQQLNLLDLVMHRISDDKKQDISYEEVAARIRQCTSTGA